MSTTYYSGQGKLYAATRHASGRPEGFAWLGNIPNLEVSVEVTKFEHTESYSGQRATDLTIVQEKKGTFTMTMEHISVANLALAFWGQSTEVAAGTGVTATVYGYLGLRSSLPYPGVSSVIVKDAAEIVTYEFGTSATDVLSLNGWIDEPNGAIHVFTDAEQTTNSATVNITDGEELHVTGYDHVAVNQLDAFTSTSQQRYLRFEGLNTVDDKTVIVDLFKADLDPLSGYGLINEELSSFEITGSILYDDLQVGASKFFKQINVQ